MAPYSRIPKHLLPYIAKQDPSLYSWVDHATWRYIMKISKAFFKGHAHSVYLEGLEATGINSERIPLISEMDEKLQKFGWNAVPIVGFIPPAPFMEFLSLAILPIACDMRKIENMAYTPAPDIVHEAAGHAPILADPEFAKYLLGYGDIARKVIYTEKDEEFFDSVRMLSDMKEDPRSTQDEIAFAQKRLEKAFNELEVISESIMLARMGWWTFEYGLIGPIDNPKIYGAGLLSSVGESYDCFEDKIKKIPMSIDCVKQSYDITKPQPQLFVTSDFQTLKKSLSELENLMAFKRGGMFGLNKAKEAKTVTTTKLDSGILIGGKVSEVILDEKNNPIYLMYSGPCQLGLNDSEVAGHGPKYHAQGFGTPIGKIKSFGKSLADLTNQELQKLGCLQGQKCKIEFESGVIIEGVFEKMFSEKSKNLIATFSNCTVTINQKGKIRRLFEPAWGTFDCACGEKVVSVYGGAPDRGAYIEATGGHKDIKNTQSSNLTKENTQLNEFYGEVRKIRDEFSKTKKASQNAINILEEIYRKLKSEYPNDWLLRYELLEINYEFSLKALWAPNVMNELLHLSKESHEKEKLIGRGLALLKIA